MTQLRDTAEDQYAQHRFEVDAEAEVARTTKAHRRAATQLWRERMSEQRAQALLPNPAQVADIWKSRRYTVTGVGETVATPRDLSYVRTVEATYHNSGGMIPAETLVDMHPTDLEIMLQEGDYKPEFLIEMAASQELLVRQAEAETAEVERRFRAGGAENCCYPC